MQTVIHVNQHHIKRNAKEGTDDPVLTVKTYKSNDYGHEAVIKLPDGTEVGRFVYRPLDPLSCGAKVWFMTDLDVEVLTREPSLVTV
jgi:hypothetical protein